MTGQVHGDPRIRVIAHEAGHVVVALILGGKDARASLDPPNTFVRSKEQERALLDTPMGCLERDTAVLIAAAGTAGATIARLPDPWEGEEWDVEDAALYLGAPNSSRNGRTMSPVPWRCCPSPKTERSMRPRCGCCGTRAS